MGLPSQEASLLQIQEDVHERLVKNGCSLTKLFKQEQCEKDKMPMGMCKNSLNWTTNLILGDRVSRRRSKDEEGSVSVPRKDGE